MLDKFFLVKVGGRPCCLGKDPEQRKKTFLDIVHQLGQFYSFSFADYGEMRTSELLELYRRFCDEIKRRKRK